MDTTNKRPNGPRNAPAFIPVLDHEAFADKYMPNLGHTVKETKVFHWKVQGWKKLEEKLASPEFSCGGHKWRILLLPFGLPDAPPNEGISVYLDHADSNLSEGWHACAQFALVISNPRDPAISTVNHTHHRFVAEKRDYGFTHFSELCKLSQPQPGEDRPTIEDDCAVISACVRVLEDPTGVLWHDFVDHGSKKEIDYVGLKNLGATGYMNVVLQSLFCTNDFRKAVYQIPTEGKRPTDSVPLALQRVFYNLQTSDRPVDTTELTKALGWKPIDSFLQHDVQEFNRALQDKLEPLMRGTRGVGVIPKLFVGRMKSLFECVNVDYELSKMEEFNDIELKVKGISTLYDSFRDYIAVEMLDGERKFQTKEFGLQDARKRTTFQSFPPVLHLPLKRQEYDTQRDSMVKIDGRFEFPLEIDLGDFLDKATDRTKPWKYRLYGVLVHSGDLHGGQYSAFIKPNQHSQWLKFDDTQVTPVTDQEVLEDNYGGESLSDAVPKTQGSQVKAAKESTDARMLVYIRETAIDEVLAPLTQADIPPHLKRGLDEERAQIEARKKEREKRLFLTAKVITNETFSRHQGFDLATFDEMGSPLYDLATFRVPKQTAYSAFRSIVAKHFSYPESRIRLWVLVDRLNRTVRPDKYIPENEPSLTVEAIRNNMAAQQNDLRLYLDVLPDSPKPDTAGSVMVFLKHFDAAKQSLLGIGKVYMPGTSKATDLIPVINERMKWEPGKSMKFYEEIKHGMVEPMKLDLTFTQSEFHDGDIICFQTDITDGELRDLESQGLYSDPPQFYGFLYDRVVVLFKPMFDQPGANQPEFSLVLSRKQDHEAMATEVGEYLKHDPIKLRFTTTDAAKSTLKRGLNQKIADIILPSSSTAVILYEKLNMSVIDLENRRTLAVTWAGLTNGTTYMFLFLLPETNTVHDLVSRLSNLVSLTLPGTGRIRVFGVTRDLGTKTVFAGPELIGDIPDSVDLFAEEIPLELVFLLRR